MLRATKAFIKCNSNEGVGNEGFGPALFPVLFSFENEQFDFT